jgi:Zn-dependent protease
MKWSWKLGQVAGIGIYAHWTFLLLIVWIMTLHLGAGAGLGTALEGIAFVLAIFGCVVLHELGHALTAKRFNIRTQDITLLPIGGVARMERIPEEPREELWIALAGPAVNVLIAAILFAIGTVATGVASLYDVAIVGGDFMTKLMLVNVILVGFNLLPAFPMDGGRVLRALLAHQMSYVRATRIAATIGQGMAIAFCILPFVGIGNWMLIFIALFVFIGAEQEARMVQAHALLKDVETRTAMMTRFHALSPDDSLGAAADELLAGAQEDFPVLEHEQLVGILPRNRLIKALAEDGPDVAVRSVMRRDCPVADEHNTLEDTFEKIREAECSSLPVVHDGRLVGMVTLQNIGDWMMVRSALDRNGSPEKTDELLKV